MIIDEHDARGLLESYVRAGKLMQVATVSGDGNPAVCNVWYSTQFGPDRLYFISRPDRDHSANVRSREHVAGGVVHIPLVGLGQKVTGVTFKGTARELSSTDHAAIEGFLSRWPAARDSIADPALSAEQQVSRLYEISVSEWVLFDERAFPGSPRRVLAGLTQPI
jgi:uncharacterized protein YhbP (UPF0306 family)